MENRKYYSDLITDNQIKKWIDNKDYVYLDGSTGTGKSTFVFEKLFSNYILNDYIPDNNYKIFVLSNRKKLFEQHIKEIKRRRLSEKYFDINGYSSRFWDCVEVETYQCFFDKYVKDKQKAAEIKEDWKLFADGDFIIICDEFHYFLNDEWNKTTEQTLQFILDVDMPTFFLSATGKSTYDFINKISHKKIENVVTIKQDFSNITLHEYKEPNSYKSNHHSGTDKAYEMIRDILNNTSDKVMYYLNDVNKLCDLKERLLEYADDVKICYAPKPNINYKYQSQKDDSIIGKKMNCRCILTTKILDNGIDILDDDLKHVIIDMQEAETIIQAIGRKRTKTPLNVYIREVDKRQLGAWIDKKQYELNNISNKNELKRYKCKILIDDYRTFINKGITKTIYERLKDTNIKYIENDYKMILTSYLEHSYINHKAIDPEYLKDIIVKYGLTGKTPNTINKSLASKDIRYKIEIKRHGKKRVTDWYARAI